jgi:hypothetical protein
MILILSGVWSVVNAHPHSQQLASPILLYEDWDYYHYYTQSINMLRTSSYVMDDPVPIIVVLWMWFLHVVQKMNQISNLCILLKT